MGRPIPCLALGRGSVRAELHPQPGTQGMPLGVLAPWKGGGGAWGASFLDAGCLGWGSCGEAVGEYGLELGVGLEAG